MKRVALRRVARVLYEITIAAGSMACVLAWLGVKPGAIKNIAIPWSNWIWLLLAGAGFAFSLRDTLVRLIGYGRTLPTASTPLNAPLTSSLQGKVSQLARDLAAFLRELGPEPMVHADPKMSDEEILSLGSDSMRPERVHHGYMRRFRDRAVNLLHEFGENGVTNTGIEIYQVDPPEIQREKEVRKLVRQLFIVAANMDIERELGSSEFPAVAETVSKRPHLSCVRMDPFGMYQVLPGIIGFGFTVINDESRYASVAHNVRASIRFRHVLGDEQAVNCGVWYDGQRFYGQVSLGMGEQSTLLILFWSSQDSQADYRAVKEFPPIYANAPTLEYGEWSVDVALIGDNVTREHKMALTLLPRGGISQVVRE